MEDNEYVFNHVLPLNEIGFNHMLDRFNGGSLIVNAIQAEDLEFLLMESGNLILEE